jgi:hypothetical protein
MKGNFIIQFKTKMVGTTNLPCFVVVKTSRGWENFFARLATMSFCEHKKELLTVDEAWQTTVRGYY